MSTKVSGVNARSNETKWTVPAGETGAIPGDGSGTRNFTTVPKPPGHNVTTNAGRRAVGQPLARPGAIRDGQGASRANGVGTGYNQRTGARPEMTGRPSIRANQAETSLDAERRILAAPDPFKYDNSTANMPTGRLDYKTLGIPYEVQAPVDAKPQSYGSPVMSDKEMLAATGDTKPQGYNSINSGFPTRGNQRQAGKPGSRNANTSNRENARVRQRPGGF